MCIELIERATRMSKKNACAHAAAFRARISIASNILKVKFYFKSRFLPDQRRISRDPSVNVERRADSIDNRRRS